MSSGPTNTSISVLLDGLRNFRGKVVNQSVLNTGTDVNTGIKQSKGQDFKDVWRDQLRTQKNSAANERAQTKETELKQRNREQMEANRADKAQTIEKNSAEKPEYQKTENASRNQNPNNESAVSDNADKASNDTSARDVANERATEQEEKTCQHHCGDQAAADSEADAQVASSEPDGEVTDTEVADPQSLESAVAQTAAIELNDGNILPPEIIDNHQVESLVDGLAQPTAGSTVEIATELNPTQAKLSESGIASLAYASGNGMIEGEAQIAAAEKVATATVGIDSPRVKTSVLDALNQQATVETESEVQEKLNQSNAIAAATRNNAGTTTTGLAGELANAEARLAGNREFFTNADTMNEGLRGNLSAQSADPGVGVSRETLQLARNLAAQMQTNATASTQSAMTEAGKAATVETSGAELKAANAVQSSMTQPQANNLSLTRAGAMQAAIPFNQNHAQFMNTVAERVLWMASKNIQAAEIHMDPADLGPIQVRIAVNQDQASVNFVAHHTAVREVLDLNVMRLREMFENEGIDLVNVDISDRSQQQEQEQGEDRRSHFSFNGDSELGNETHAVTGTIAGGNHLVDFYA